MFVGVGSRSNIDDPDTTPAEKDRATFSSSIPMARTRVYATGSVTPAGFAINPTTGQAVGRR